MLLLEIKAHEIKKYCQKIIPLLNQYPEFFIIVPDRFPNTSTEFRSEFGLWSNDVIQAKTRKQIILLAEIPSFLPSHNYLKFDDSKEFNIEQKLLELKSFLYFENIEIFYDEIAFLLLQYGEIYIADTRSEIQSDKAVAQIRSAEIERKFVEFEMRINNRIHPNTWKITLFLKHSIQTCRPSAAGPLSQDHWIFRKGNQLPHDRFWADKHKRIFISSSVGIEFKEDHKPIIYRLSSLIRSRRSQIISFN